MKIYSILDAATTHYTMIEIQVIVVDGVVRGITVPCLPEYNPRRIPIYSTDFVKIGDEVRDLAHLQALAKDYVPFGGNIIEYDLSEVRE